MGRLLFLWCFVMFGCVSDFDTECVVDDDCKDQESCVDNRCTSGTFKRRVMV